MVLYSTGYRTVPDERAEEVRIVIGGDVGFEGEGIASTLLSHLVEYDPHAIIIGGDDAYDDGYKTCYYSWDTVYYLFEEINQKLKRLVPLVFSIGNHDVGYHALADVKINFDDVENVPYYFTFNPQHTLH
jgi:metallophosphoesterase superfamily enzyme